MPLSVLYVMLYALMTSIQHCSVMGNSPDATQSNPTTQVPLSPTNLQPPIVRLVWSVKMHATATSPSKSALLGKRLGSSPQKTQQNKVYTLLNGGHLSEFWPLAADFPRGRIYYSDFVENHIGVYIVQTGYHRKLYQGKSYGIDGIAVDWMTGNVYWTDTTSNEIVVVDHTFRFHKSIGPITSRSPAKIAVDSIAGTIFWSERARGECRLWRSDLAGGNRVLLHRFQDVISIDELSVDVEEGRLYWTERGRGSPRISRVRFFETDHPNDTFTIYEARNTQLTGVASYKDALYICDHVGNKFLMYNKTTDESLPVHQHQFNVRPRSVVVFGAEVQPFSYAHHFSHPCTFALCNQLCLVTETSFVCACDVGYVLSDDEVTCTLALKEKDFMLLIDSGFRKFYQVSMEDPLKYNAIPMKDEGTAYAVTFDPVDEKVYWTDAGSMVVWRAFLNGSNQEVFFNGTRVYSISLDPVSRNLYVADETVDAIVVISLEIPRRFYTIHVRNIHAVYELFASPQLGKIFWTDWGQLDDGKQEGLVEMANLDGTDRRVIVNGTSSPHGITADPESGIVYWTESFSETIGWYNLFTGESGKCKLSTNKTFSNLAGLSYHSGYLYFTDYEHDNVQRIAVSDVLNKKQASAVEPFGPEIFYGLSTLAIIPSNVTGSTACSTNRGNCPEICLPSPDLAATCKCSDNSIYKPDHNACFQVNSTGDVTRPSFGSNCPENFVIPVDKCADTATFYFDLPNATDDSRHVYVKSERFDKSPYKLVTGNNHFQFKAFDLSRNVASCSFVVFVEDIVCDIPPEISQYEAYAAPSCGVRFGSVLNTTCRSSGLLSRQYECGLDNKWSVTFSDPGICTPTIAGTTPTPTSDAGRLATSSTSFKPSEGSETTQTSTSTSTSRDADVLNETTRQTQTASSTPTRGSNGNYTSDLRKSEIKNEASSKRQPSLHGGLIAFIVLFVIAVILLAVFLYKKFGNKKLSGKLVIWKQSEDRVQLTTDPAEGHIYHFAGDTSSRSSVTQPILM